MSEENPNPLERVAGVAGIALLSLTKVLRTGAEMRADLEGTV
ncbi:hypothetical protein AB0425_25570 [Actinosynnema sp. NPDC051121]